MDQTVRRAHLNLVESSRQLFALDSGATLVEADGCMLGAGSSDNPAISNAAFRVDDDLDPAELLRRAGEFFGARGRGFSLWTRGDRPRTGTCSRSPARRGSTRSSKCRRW